MIYITEALASELSEEIDKYREQYLPAVIQIPGVSGNTGSRSFGCEEICGAGNRFRYYIREE